MRAASTLPPRVRLHDQMLAWERSAKRIREVMRIRRETPASSVAELAIKDACLTVCEQRASAYEECANDLDLLLYEMEGEL